MSKWLQDFFQYKSIVEANLTVTSAATVQQYYKYTYESTVYVGATSGTWPTKGLIQFNNADTSIATECALANLTNEVVDQGIGSYIAEQPAGVYMHVRSTQTNKFGIYKIAAAPASRTAHKYFAVTVVNGLALNDGDEVTVSFSSNANCVWDATNNTITANGVAVAPNALTLDTMADINTVSISAANDGLGFFVKDPGNNSTNELLEVLPWIFQVDYTGNKYKHANAMSPFASLNTWARFSQPASALTYTIATDSSVTPGRTKLTNASHGLTFTSTKPQYLKIKTASTGWTAKQLVKILAINGNDVIVDVAYSASLANPIFYIVGDVEPILEVNYPALRAYSRCEAFVSIDVPNNANNKTPSATLGGSGDIWSPAALTTTNGVGRILSWKNAGDTAKNNTMATANSNTGNGEALIGTVRENMTIQTNVSTVLAINMQLANSGDYFDLVDAYFGGMY